jgi:hypothetical protein
MAIDNTQTLPGAVPQNDSGAQPQMVSPVAPAPQAPSQAPQAPTQQPTQQQPSVTSAPVPPSPNQRLHSFVSSVLGGITSSLAGRPAVKYSVDPTTGKMGPDPNQPEDTRGNQVRRILGNALTGLGAGAQAGGQKSGLANALSGLGAGAAAQTASSQAADKQAKQQADQDNERQQQKIMQQYQIAHTNAMTYTTYAHDMREEDEHDPQRKKYSQWADAAEQGGLDVRTMSAQEAKAAQASDPSFATNHLLLPAGFKPQVGPKGEVLTDPTTGQPLRDGQVLVIQGGHMDASGNKVVSLPSSLVNDVHKYGDLLGIGNAKGLKEGDEVDADQFFKLIGVAQEGNRKQQEGWLKPTISVDQATGKTFEKNTNTGEVREAKAIPVGDATKIAAEKTATAKEAETERHNRTDEANKASELSLKKAENNFINPSGSSGLSGDAYLQTLPQPQRDLLASIAEGRNTKAAIQNRKGELTPLGLAVMQAYPDFNVQKAAKYGDTLKEYQSTKNGTAGGSLNAGATALKHLASLKQINDANPLDVRIHGTKANLAYNNLLDTVADELVTFYNEPKTNETIASKKSTLGSLANRDSAIVEQAKAMSAKLQSFQQSWDNASPRASFRPPMPYIDNDARKSLQTLAPDFVAANPQFAPSQQQQTQPAQQQNRPANGQPAMPVGATHIVQGPDGKNHYTNANGTVDYGVAQ